MKKEFSGFIVHPFETLDGKYQASFGKDKNRTNKSFRTLSDAKKYLLRNGVKIALYDSPSGPKNISTTQKRRKR